MQNVAELLQTASASFRRGRFADALVTLQGCDPGLSSGPMIRCLLADALQRTGRNQEAEELASQILRFAATSSELTARCHFVLGNVSRERGNVREAIVHFQTAARLAERDLELSGWVQLRLMMTIAELAGSHTALGRLADLKRTLTRHGDARPFAALHLWIAETESMRGNLDNAKRHLQIAEALLSTLDDVWLRGYFAINSFGVSYHSADILEATKWAKAAIDYSRLSGHAAAHRAAHANLGQLEFSLGHFSEAERCFLSALQCCQEGSTDYIAIVDSLAQIKLHLDDLTGCRALIDKLDNLSIRDDDSKRSHYRAWAFQTKIQLLLKEGRTEEAKQVCNQVRLGLQSDPHSRVATVLCLSAIETLIASREFAAAAQQFKQILSSAIEPPPDLFAETERMIAKTLALSGTHQTARTHLQRAIDTFETIGHRIGKKSAASDLDQFQQNDQYTVEPSTARTCIDRARTLLDMCRRPELFGREAVRLLRDLACARAITLRCRDTAQLDEIIVSHGESAELLPAEGVQIDLGSTGQKQFTLRFWPDVDPASIIASITFERLIKRVIGVRIQDLELDTCEILWSDNEGVPNQEVLFAADSMLRIMKTIRKISQTDLSVLITGETGTGKEIIARAIHEQSDRASRPFVALNCAAVPKELLESQLFGYKRGAFSGATEQFQGVIRAATGGTLLLDEVVEIPLDVQPKLLRFLDTGEVHPLGEARPLKVDVRLLFATNADLEAAVKQGRFREDLFFRMSVIPIKVPPLRERREEIPLLANLFARRFSRELDKANAKFATEVMERFVLYSWPGNVRQLRNEIRRLIATADDGAVLGSELLSAEISKASDSSTAPLSDSPQITVHLNQELGRAMSILERSMVEHALKQSGGRMTRAAQALGLSRKGLYLKRQRFGILDIDVTDTSSRKLRH